MHSQQKGMEVKQIRFILESQNRGCYSHKGGGIPQWVDNIPIN